MRGAFHICMILQISENSVAAKNIISKIMVLFRREISLSNHKEKGKKKTSAVFIFFSVLSSTATISLSFCRPYFIFSLAISNMVSKKIALFKYTQLGRAVSHHHAELCM